MNATRIARSRRLTAALESATGRDVPPDLIDRITRELETDPRIRRPSPTPKFFVAAAATLGVAVVLAMNSFGSGSSENSPQQELQDPQRATKKGNANNPRLTTAMVREAVLALDEVPAPGPAVTRLLDVCRDSRLAIVVDATITAKSHIDFGGLGRREAVDQIAREIGAGVAEFDGVLLVNSRGPKPRALERSRITLDARAVTMQQLAKVVHARAGANLVVAANAAGHLDVEVENVPWRALLTAAAKQLGHEVIGHGSALTVRPATERPKRVPAMQQTSGSNVQNVFDGWAKAVGLNLVIGAGIDAEIAMFAFEPRSNGLLRAIAASADAEVVDETRGIVRIVPTLDRGKTSTHTAESISELELLQAAGPIPVTLTAAGKPLTVFAANARTLDLVRAAAAANGLGFVRRDDHYVVH